MTSKSMRAVIKQSTGQDIARCLGCLDCDISLRDKQDIPIGSLIQLALLEDEEALHCRTLWSDSVLEASRGACKRGLDLHAVMLALREESTRRAGK